MVGGGVKGRGDAIAVAPLSLPLMTRGGGNLAKPEYGVYKSVQQR